MFIGSSVCEDLIHEEPSTKVITPQHRNNSYLASNVHVLILMSGDALCVCVYAHMCLLS